MPWIVGGALAFSAGVLLSIAWSLLSRQPVVQHDPEVERQWWDEMAPTFLKLAEADPWTYGAVLDAVDCAFERGRPDLGRLTVWVETHATIAETEARAQAMSVFGAEA